MRAKAAGGGKKLFYLALPVGMTRLFALFLLRFAENAVFNSERFFQEGKSAALDKKARKSVKWDKAYYCKPYKREGPG